MIAPVTPKCLTPGCPNEAVTVGICKGCHQAQQRAIRRGDCTEEELVAWGWRLGKRIKPRGRFALALQKKRAEATAVPDEFKRHQRRSKAESGP
jgi:hypothetical protein